jgi:hypothetical protein
MSGAAPVRYDISDRVYIDGENLVVEARPPLRESPD